MSLPSVNIHASVEVVVTKAEIVTPPDSVVDNGLPFHKLLPLPTKLLFSRENKGTFEFSRKRSPPPEAVVIAVVLPTLSPRDRGYT